MNLTVITSPDFLPEEQHVISKMLHEGAHYVHVRKPGASRDQLMGFLESFSAYELSKMILSGEREDFSDLSLGGFHTQRKLPFEKNSFLSSSAHSLEEINDKKAWAKHIYISPIFPSISKPGYENQNLLKELESCNEIPENLVALGGIHKGNWWQVEKLGFKGAAVLGAIWNSHNPMHAFRKFIPLLKD